LVQRTFAIISKLSRILKDPDSVEYQLGLRQLAIKDCDSNSWFITVNEILLSYELPFAHKILLNPKKNLKPITHTVVNFSYRVLYVPVCCLWHCSNTNLVVYISMYLFPYNLTLTLFLHLLTTCFSRLCQKDTEDYVHFLLKCDTLSTIRNNHLVRLAWYLEKIQVNTDYLVNSEKDLLQLIIDCSASNLIDSQYTKDVDTICRDINYTGLMICWVLYVPVKTRDFITPFLTSRLLSLTLLQHKFGCLYFHVSVSLIAGL
jgi:hypothetical protein